MRKGMEPGAAGGRRPTGGCVRPRGGGSGGGEERGGGSGGGDSARAAQSAVGAVKMFWVKGAISPRLCRRGPLP